MIGNRKDNAYERFSLDDPEAGRKLVENLDARKVRLVFSELCWHFDCDDYDQKMRLRAFLLELSMTGVIVEVLPNLYCRPALTGGSSDSEAIFAATERIAKIRRSSKKDTSRRDVEAKTLHDFALGCGERVTTVQLGAKAAEMGLKSGRVSYLIQHLRTTGVLQMHRYGVYKVIRPDAERPAETVTDEDSHDDA